MMCNNGRNPDRSLYAEAAPTIVKKPEYYGTYSGKPPQALDDRSSGKIATSTIGKETELRDVRDAPHTDKTNDVTEPLEQHTETK